MLNKVVKINNLVSLVFFHYTDDKKRKIVKNSEAFLFFIYQMEEYSIAFTAQVHLWGWHPPLLVRSIQGFFLDSTHYAKR